MNIVWQPVISRSMIEESVSEEQIMEYYLGIPCKKGLFRNPLRTDKHKTAGFYRDKKGQLIFKDFAGYFYGN